MKTQRRIASDFDNTFTTHPEIHGQVQVVITGRSWQEYDDLMIDWMGLPEKPFFMNPVDAKDNSKLHIVNHKANIINKLQVDKFYEDVPDEAQMLRIMCPGTKIILVEEGKTAI